MAKLTSPWVGQLEKHDPSVDAIKKWINEAQRALAMDMYTESPTYTTGCDPAIGPDRSVSYTHWPNTFSTDNIKVWRPE